MSATEIRILAQQIAVGEAAVASKRKDIEAVVSASASVSTGTRLGHESAGRGPLC